MGSIDYTPQGLTGYVCVITSDQGRSMKLTRERLEGDPTVEGDDELCHNKSVVRTVDAYAASELANRRARQKERKKAFAKSAELYQRVAVDLVDLIDDVGDDDTRQAWCSACLTKTDHRHVERPSLTPDAWICSGCGAATTPCLWPACTHFAVRKPRALQLGKYCAEHLHTIPSFEKLDDELDSLATYTTWLEFDSKHAKRITALTGGVLGGALIVAPLFAVAAPAIGGAIGAWGTGLSGAAASSHGLALLGGGAVAAGGGGVAVGTAVVTAAGAGLGTAVGASVSTAYAGDDPSFGIDTLLTGTGPTVVLASGFLTEDQAGWGEWESTIRDRYPDATVYRLRWGAKEQRDLRILLGREVGGKAALAGLVQTASRATRFALKKIGLIGTALTVGEVAKNPWWVARTRANMTGAVLADLIARTSVTDYVLIGHSLGARVMMSAADALGSRNEQTPQLQSVHLLGAAVSADHDLTSVGKAVTDGVSNYWSKNDRILSTAYRGGELGQRAAGSTGFTTKHPAVKNHNVSRSVGGHSEYVSNIKLR